ncbi:MAG: pirin family protein [Flavobacteriales bacterium]|jgi:redox-sensitive bicupin YhaK (pirin superfamily)
MKTKSIQQILPPPAPHMVGDGFRVHNFFPSGYNMAQDRMSPFFLMDYNSKIEFSPRENPRGVGVHPHRGFETVTIAFHGKVAHHDSAGNSGVISEGGVQWMTAGSGVLHKEYHEKEYSSNGGPFQMVQLWVNLPAKFKMTPPKYQGLNADQMGKWQSDDGNVKVDVIAGNFKGTAGAASTFSPIEMCVIRLKAGASLEFDLPADFNTGILTLEGSVRYHDEYEANTDEFALFLNDGETVRVAATEDATLFLISGAPLNEPIAAHGPFLMNTYEEIHQAILDFGQGKFGTLED